MRRCASGGKPSFAATLVLTEKTDSDAVTHSRIVLGVLTKIWYAPSAGDAIPGGTATEPAGVP